MASCYGWEDRGEKMGLTKGIRFTSVRTFVDERFGAGAWHEILATLPAADTELIRSVVPSGWYENAVRARLIRAICNVRGGGSLALGREIGSYEAQRDLTTVHRWFVCLVRGCGSILCPTEIDRGTKTAECPRFCAERTWALA